MSLEPEPIARTRKERRPGSVSPPGSTSTVTETAKETLSFSAKNPAPIVAPLRASSDLGALEGIKQVQDMVQVPNSYGRRPAHLFAHRLRTCEAAQ